MNLYVTILAGGAGTRFWPWSRNARPKQLIQLSGPDSMIEDTFRRVEPLVSAEHILISTRPDLVDPIRQLLPECPERNYVVEPVPRNTAPCIGLAVSILHRLDSSAVMAVLPSDHYIDNETLFRTTLRAAADYAATSDTIVTLGIPAEYPETGYGYIHFAERIAVRYGLPIHHVREFVEKPDVETAGRYLESGEYLWNGGIFIASVATFRKAFELHQPELFAGLQRIEEAVDTPRESATIRDVFPRLPRVSIDFGIMESYDNVCTIPGRFGWSDVGGYRALYNLVKHDENENALHGPVIQIDSSGNFIRSDGRLVATIGIRDLVVIAMEDAVLVCPLDDACRINQIVTRLKEIPEYQNVL